MIKVTVISKAGFEFSNVLSTQAEIDAWLEQEKQRGAWGRRQSWLHEDRVSQADIANSLASRIITNYAPWFLETELGQEAIDNALESRLAVDENSAPILDEDSNQMTQHRLQDDTSYTEYELPDEFSITVEDIGDTIAVAALREQRDRLLTSSDWTQLADTVLTQPDIDAWATYRQELRDLPANVVDSSNPIWPAKP